MGRSSTQRTYAPFHQHFLVARLDLDVDGERNTVHVDRIRGATDRPGQPVWLGLVQRSTPLTTEHEGKQDYDWGSQRAWKVINEQVRNRLGSPVGYKLVPGGCFPACSTRDSPVFGRAQAIAHTLWVTPFHEEERWPCGEFVVQSREDRGLPIWTAAGPLDRGHRRCALVRLRHPPHHATGGLAGHVRGHRFLLAQAVRLLRPQPRPRRAADHSPLPYRGGSMIHGITERSGSRVALSGAGSG